MSQETGFEDFRVLAENKVPKVSLYYYSNCFLTQLRHQKHKKTPFFPKIQKNIPT